jgi:hypothetical protein
MIDDHRHLTRNIMQRGSSRRQHPVIAEELHHPAELGHGVAKHLEHIKPDAADVIRPLRKQMKA